METRASYSVRIITDPTSPDFRAAIDVYLATIPPRIRTNTNEIAHWIRSYHEHFEDRFHVLAFRVGRRVVGYAELAYFRAEHLIVIDYVAILPEYRRNNVFFEFAAHLRRLVEAQRWDVHYVVAEVACEDDPHPGPEAASLVRLLKLEGFRVARAPYYQPRLSRENPESELRALLLINVPAAVRSISRETYLRIVRTIYWKHYLRWFSMYGAEEQATHEALLERLMERITDGVGGARRIHLNGFGTTLGASESSVSVATERNLATNAVLLAMTLALALSSGTLPLPVSLTLWVVLLLGVVIAVAIWPNDRRRAWLWTRLGARAGTARSPQDDGQPERD